MHDKPAMSREVRATVKFRNPLPLSLKDGKFFIAGSSLPKTLEIKVGKVSAKKTTSVSFKFTPQFTGKQVISAKFTSKQLQDVDGYLQFMV
ncbi:annulin-like [Myzus persicae]|nr:annulin-like [Myzus persicae]